MIEPAFDPLHEKLPRLHHRRLHVLGAEFIVSSNEPCLIELVDEAFAGLPAHKLAAQAPRLKVDLVLAEGQSTIGPNAPPPLQFRSNGDLIVGAFDAINFAAISVARRSALISVSSEMLNHRYELRYELIEFAFRLLAPRVQSLLTLHAACVGLDDKGVLLDGRSGSGKSTLSLACMLRGLSLLAEDSVFISSEELLVTGCSGFLYLRTDALRYVGDVGVADRILASRVIRRRGGTEKIELDVRGRPFSLASGPLRLAALILLSEQHANGSGPLMQLPIADAIPILTSNQPYAQEHPQWPQFLRSLTSVPAYRLDRSAHPDAAAEALRELLSVPNR